VVTESGQCKFQLMGIHINTLFRCDPDERLRSVNEPGEPLAPRFFMGRTQAGNLWRFRYDLPNDTVQQLEQLCQSEPLSSDLVSTPRNYAAIKAVLHEHAPVQDEYRGPAYWVPASVQVPTNVVLISETNAQLLQTGFPWMLPLPRDRDIGPIAAAVAQGIAVAVCYCSRLPDQATEAGVETMEAFRGKGYATVAVAGWAAAVRRRGVIPLYSTSWDNLASQGVARKLGMVLYGEDWWMG
jgi:hypothetical protein